MDSLENTWANNDKLIIHEIRHWEQNGPVDITSSDWHFTAVVWTLQALTQTVDVKLHHNSIKRFKSTHKTSFFCYISYVNIQFSCVGCDFMLEAAYIFSCISCELSVENNLIQMTFLTLKRCWKPTAYLQLWGILIDSKQISFSSAFSFLNVSHYRCVVVYLLGWYRPNCKNLWCVVE